MKDLSTLNDEELLVYWDEVTEVAESTDDWSEVARVEVEVERRGLK